MKRYTTQSWLVSLAEVIVFHRCRWLIVLGLALGLTGCGEEEKVARYKGPRVEPVKFGVAANKETSALLGAILPLPDKIWFIKVAGPQEAIAEIKGAFEDLVRSVRFTKDQETPLTWTTPPGWKEGPKPKPGDLRFASIVVPTQAKKLDLSILPLGLESKSVLDNVNRWRGQIGLPQIGADNLKDVVKTIEVDDVKVTLVELVGAAPKPKKAPPKVNPGGLPFEYQKPEGWTQYAPNDGVNLVGFKIREGNLDAKATIGSVGGDVVQNIVRWCGQVQMTKPQIEQALRQVKDLEIDGQEAKLVDLSNPQATVADNHILGVILPLGDATWFIKMTGPTELVARQKATFETFVRSFRFEGKGVQP